MFAGEGGIQLDDVVRDTSPTTNRWLQQINSSFDAVLGYASAPLVTDEPTGQSEKNTPDGQSDGTVVNFLTSSIKDVATRSANGSRRLMEARSDSRDSGLGKESESDGRLDKTPPRTPAPVDSGSNSPRCSSQQSRSAKSPRFASSPRHRKFVGSAADAWHSDSTDCSVPCKKKLVVLSEDDRDALGFENEVPLSVCPILDTANVKGLCTDHRIPNSLQDDRCRKPLSGGSMDLADATVEDKALYNLQNKADAVPENGFSLTDIFDTHRSCNRKMSRSVESTVLSNKISTDARPCSLGSRMCASDFNRLFPAFGIPPSSGNNGLFRMDDCGQFLSSSGSEIRNGPSQSGLISVSEAHKVISTVSHDPNIAVGSSSGKNGFLTSPNWPNTMVSHSFSNTQKEINRYSGFSSSFTNCPSANLQTSYSVDMKSRAKSRTSVIDTNCTPIKSRTRRSSGHKFGKYVNGQRPPDASAFSFQNCEPHPAADFSYSFHHAANGSFNIGDQTFNLFSNFGRDCHAAVGSSPSTFSFSHAGYGDQTSTVFPTHGFGYGSAIMPGARSDWPSGSLAYCQNAGPFGPTAERHGKEILLSPQDGIRSRRM